MSSAMRPAYQQSAVQQPRGAVLMARPNAPAGTFLPGTKIQIGSHRVVIDRYLSEGGFAHVYVVRLPQPIDGEELAVLKRVAVPDKDALSSMKTEVETMKKLKGHTHIVKYIDSHASGLKDGGYEVFLLMEFCNGGGLIDFMNTRLQNRLTEPEILKIFSDSCQGMAAMHYLKPPLLHRDLKVENILITGTGSAKQFKLCDFGSAAPPRPAATTVEEGRLIEEDIQKNTTAQYRSPEMIDVYRKQPIDEKSDIWALGCFLYKLCYYTTPFEEQGQMAILNASFRFPAYPPFSDRLKRLIAMMLQEQPSKRPNIYLVFREVCSMRNRECTLKDIYSGRTASEARKNQQLPPPPTEEAPSGITKVAPPTERKLAVPEVTPMRRGRPTSSSVSKSLNPSPSPGRPASHDPFSALDGRQGESAQAAAIDELSSKFPSLDQFSLLHDSGSQFSFGGKPVTSPPPTQKPQITDRQQELSQKVTEALADDAFARPKSVAPTIAQKPAGIAVGTGRSSVATQTSFPVTKSPESVRPKMVSTGTMTSPSPPKTYTPEISTRPIFRIPPQQSARTNASGQVETPTSEGSSRAGLSVPRPGLLQQRSKSQTDMTEATANAALISLDDPEPPNGEDTVHRTRSTNTRSRPLSASIGSATRFLHGRSPSHSQSRPDRTSAILIDTSDAQESETAPIESNVEFLRQMEEEDSSKRHHKRLSSTGGLASLKRSSIGQAGSATKHMLAGKFGDAFKLFETNGKDAPAELAVEVTDGAGALTPIAGSTSFDGRSDDGQVIEETEDVSPEMRRELERRRLSQEERRVAEAAAAYKQRVSTTGTGTGPGSQGTSRASAIQNRVQALLEESAQKSPTKTAEGYGRFTNPSTPRDEERSQTLPQLATTAAAANTPAPQQGIARAASTASAPAGPVAPDNAFPRPSAPLKPQGLRTGGPGPAPAVARKPAKLAGTGTGQSLLRQRLAMDQANSQAGHAGPEIASPAAADPAVERRSVQGDDDWETVFSKRYPSLGNLEMEEMKI